MYAAETSDLWKIYSKGSKSVVALQEVYLKIKLKAITGILGRNGAGKTTLVRILGTQLMPTRGTAYVLGHDVVKEAGEIRKRIAVLPQEAQPMLFPSPLEYVKYVLVMRGASFSEAEREAKISLEEMGVPRKYWNRSMWSLSGGLRRRVILALLLATGAELVFLDEPSIGLDPLARRGLWKSIFDLRKRGATILLTTHYMEEASVLCDEVVVLHRGRVLGHDTPKNLVESLGVKYKLVVSEECPWLSKIDADAALLSSPPYILYYKSMEAALDVSKSLSHKDCAVKLEPVTLEDYMLLSLSGEGS